MTADNRRSARFRDWALMAVSSASLALGVGLSAIRIPFRNLIDRSLADAGWPSSLTLVVVLFGISAVLGVAYGLLPPTVAGGQRDGA